MANIYNLFKFLEDKKGKKIPFKLKLIHAPETIKKEDLNVEGGLDLSETKISFLPDNLTVGGYLSLEQTPLSSKYSEEQIRKMIEEKGGKVKGRIYT